MKKCFLLMAVLAACSCSVQSQVINKGDRLFGGSFSLSYFDNDGATYNNTISNIGMLPSFGWAVKENLVLGIKGSIGYSRSKTVNATADETISTSFSAGPGIFLRKYKSLKNRFGVYFNHELNGYYTFQEQKGGLAIPSTSKAWGGSYNFNPGVFYKFSDRFLGEANIGGLAMSYTGNGTTDNFGIGATFLQYFNVGINYVIRKK